MMKLSAPIYRLKRQAKLLSRAEKIPVHEALDRVASLEGFTGWSLLAAKATSPAVSIYRQLSPGDLLLIASRPGQGKTLLSLELGWQAMKAGAHFVFFSLEYTARDCERLLREIGVDSPPELFDFDGSDWIDAEHILAGLEGVSRGTFVVVDYLQLLDQRRESAPLMAQVRSLRAFARERGVTMAFLNQVGRSYDPSVKPTPDLGDVRLPNPLDLSLFDRFCFLQGGEVRFAGAWRAPTSRLSEPGGSG